MDDAEIDWTLSEFEQTFLLPGEREISHETMRRRIAQYYAQTWAKSTPAHNPKSAAADAAIREARRMLEETAQRKEHSDQ